ncbi:MAG: antibiotic biosynthesis monooxygenase [Pyrinomonadaceae bacterium]
MFVVLYRWRVKKGLEEEFSAAWDEITAYLFDNYDSLGSRLHRGNDGIFYAYAQWRSAEQRENAFAERPELEASEKMKRAIEESFPEVILEIIADRLVPVSGPKI